LSSSLEVVDYLIDVFIFITPIPNGDLSSVILLLCVKKFLAFCRVCRFSVTRVPTDPPVKLPLTPAAPSPAGGLQIEDVKSNISAKLSKITSKALDGKSGKVHPPFFIISSHHYYLIKIISSLFVSKIYISWTLCRGGANHGAVLQPMMPM
jgi:hypothetical protein